MKEKIVFITTIMLSIFFLVIGLHFKSLECKCNNEPVKVELSNSSLFSPAETIINLVNQERSNYNLEPLEYDQKLTNIATFKSCDMVSKNYFAHKDLEGNLIFFYMKEAGIRYKHAGENLARDFGSDWSLVMNRLMNSEKHKENILGKDYKKIGIGICNGYITQIFTDNYEKN